MQNSSSQRPKRRLEEKLGLFASSGFEKEVIDIVLDCNDREKSLFDHYRIRNERWLTWVLFLTVIDVHLAFAAIPEDDFEVVEIYDVSHQFLPEFDVQDHLKTSSVVHWFHVVKGDHERRYLEAKIKEATTAFQVNEQQSGKCFYVGTLKLSLLGLKALMAKTVRGIPFTLSSSNRWLDFYRHFIEAVLVLNGAEELSEDQKSIMEEILTRENYLPAEIEHVNTQLDDAPFPEEPTSEVVSPPYQWILCLFLLLVLFAVAVCSYVRTIRSYFLEWTSVDNLHALVM